MEYWKQQKVRSLQSAVFSPQSIGILVNLLIRRHLILFKLILNLLNHLNLFSHPLSGSSLNLPTGQIINVYLSADRLSPVVYRSSFMHSTIHINFITFYTFTLQIKNVYMEHLICANVFVPVRTGPSHKSEQGSQILFGEKYSIIDRSADWLKVRNEYDNYEGWIDNDHHIFLRTNDIKVEPDILANITSFIDVNGNKLTLEAGSEIYNFNKNDRSFIMGDKLYIAPTEVSIAPVNESITDTAARFINCPYLWGGKTSGGIDCSGLTQVVYKIHGEKIPRDSYIQAEAGRPVSFLEEAEPGDLLFFDNEQGKISHVGILFSSGYIIHSSGMVRIDRIDHQGIYNNELKKYTHRLRTIRRI